MKGPKNLENIMDQYPNNSCVLLEDKVNFKKNTLFVIKDEFLEYLQDGYLPDFNIKGAYIRKGKVLAQYIVINIQNRFINKFYKFYFDFNDSDSIRLIFNLINQNKIYIILYDTNNFNRAIELDNKLKIFFRSYVEECLHSNLQWDRKDYKKLIDDLNRIFGGGQELWNNMGETIY